MEKKPAWNLPVGGMFVWLHLAFVLYLVNSNCQVMHDNLLHISMSFLGKLLGFHPLKIFLGVTFVPTQFLCVLTRPTHYVVRSCVGDFAHGSMSVRCHCPMSVMW